MQSPTTRTDSAEQRRIFGHAALAALISTIAALAVYIPSLAPTISWGDSADLALRMSIKSDGEFNGTSREYGLYRNIGSLFQALPVNDCGYRSNLMSAAFGALAVGATAWIATILFSSIVGGIAAGLALTFSHTHWLLSSIAEVYTFNSALAIIALGSIVAWNASTTGAGWVLTAAFASGLSLAHHASGVVLTGCLIIGLVIAGRRVPRWTAACATIIYLILTNQYWREAGAQLSQGHNILQALNLTAPQNHLHTVDAPKEVFKFAAYASYNFIGLATPLAFFGVFSAIKAKRPACIPCSLWGFSFVVAGSLSSIPDKFNIYVLAYPSIAVMVGGGVARLSQTGKQQWLTIFFLALIPAITYWTTPKISGRLGIDLVNARQVPHRSNAEYFLWPPKTGDYGPLDYAREALESVAHGGVLITDYTLWRPLTYTQRIEDLRPDVTLVFAERAIRNDIVAYIASVVQDREVRLATDTPASYYDLKRIGQHFTVRRLGITLVVSPR